MTNGWTRDLARRPLLRALAASSALLAFVDGCSSAEPAASPPATDGSVSAELRAAARRALADPSRAGQPSHALASSMPGVAAWTVYRGEGITVVGKNVAGKIEVALTWQIDHDARASLIACKTSRRVACEAAAKAVVADFGASRSPIAPKGIYTSGNGCEAKIADVANDGATGFVDSLTCAEGSHQVVEGPDQVYQLDDPCILFGDAGYQIVMNLAAACCEGWDGSGGDDYLAVSQEHDGLVSPTPVRLVCAPHAELLEPSR